MSTTMTMRMRKASGSMSMCEEHHREVSLLICQVNTRPLTVHADPQRIQGV